MSPCPCGPSGCMKGSRISPTEYSIEPPIHLKLDEMFFLALSLLPSLMCSAVHTEKDMSARIEQLEAEIRRLRGEISTSWNAESVCQRQLASCRDEARKLWANEDARSASSAPSSAGATVDHSIACSADCGSWVDGFRTNWS